MSDSTTVSDIKAPGGDQPIFFEKATTRASSGGGDIVIIPPGLRRGVSVILHVASGSGKVQYTTVKRATIRSDVTSAIWLDWSNGTVTVDTGNQFGPITALRINSTSGSQTLHIEGD